MEFRRKNSNYFLLPLVSLYKVVWGCLESLSFFHIFYPSLWKPAMYLPEQISGIMAKINNSSHISDNYNNHKLLTGQISQGTFGHKQHKLPLANFSRKGYLGPVTDVHVLPLGHFYIYYCRFQVQTTHSYLSPSPEMHRRPKGPLPRGLPCSSHLINMGVERAVHTHSLGSQLKPGGCNFTGLLPPWPTLHTSYSFTQRHDLSYTNSSHLSCYF